MSHAFENWAEEFRYARSGICTSTRSNRSARSWFSIPGEEAGELTFIYEAKGSSHEEAKPLTDRLVADPAKPFNPLAREKLRRGPGELGMSVG